LKESKFSPVPAAHHDLIPYTRSYLYQATRTGMPIMRALIFAYPDDDRLSDLWDEYLYGGEILVAPVSTASATERKVYPPVERWMNYGDSTPSTMARPRSRRGRRSA
jgi:alpha-glucosidase (family GH31 glycosyl hydrolase)